jgi:flagellar basal-body rod modification protein FlgD
MTDATTSAVSAAGSNTALTTASKTTSTTLEEASLDYDAFLTLFMAQLKNQDPTNPADSTELLAQLASFSNVAESLKTNMKLDSMMSLSVLSQAGDLIGRTLTSADGSLTGEVTALRAISGGAVAVLENGREVELGEGVKIT